MTRKHRAGDPAWMDLRMAADDDATWTAQEFYRELFGWEFHTESDDEGWIYRGNDIVGGCHLGGDGSGWRVYLKVNDLRAKIRRIMGTDPWRNITLHNSQENPTAVIEVHDSIGLWEGDGGFVWDEGHGTPAWIDLYSWNHRSSKAFYATRFRWRWVEEYEPEITMGGPPFYHATERAGITEEVGCIPTPSWTMPGWSLHIRVDDMEKALELVPRLGGETLYGPYRAPAGMLAGIVDPAGNQLGLISGDRVDPWEIWGGPPRIIPLEEL